MAPRVEPSLMHLIVIALTLSVCDMQTVCGRPQKRNDK